MNRQRILSITVLAITIAWYGCATTNQSYITLGNKRFHDGQYDSAEKCYQEALKRDPANPEIYFNLGCVWAVQGNYNRAISAYSKAIELKPDYLSAYYNRGSAWLEKSDFNRAIEDGKKIVSMSPGFYQAYYGIAESLAAKGDLAEAIVYYSKAIEINPSFTMALYGRGVTWYEMGDPIKALQDYTKVLELDPHNIRTLVNRGTIWKRKGDNKRAIADYDKALEGIDRYHSYSKSNELILFRNEENIEDLRAIIYVNRGNAWRDSNAFDRAMRDYDQAIKINPHLDKAYLNRGYAWLYQGSINNAITDYYRSINVNHTYYKAYHVLAWIYATWPDINYRNGEKALELANKLLELDVNSPQTFETYAAALGEVGRFPEAIDAQLKAIKMLKSSNRTEELSLAEERLDSYKANKPWRERIDDGGDSEIPITRENQRRTRGVENQRGQVSTIDISAAIR